MNFKDISWQVTEPEYRASKNLSYSTLATFLREGLPGLKRVLDGEKKALRHCFLVVYLTQC